MDLNQVFTVCNARNVTLVIFLISTAVWLISIWRANRGLPPGPTGLPLLGVIPFMAGKLDVTLIRWARQYGDIMSAKIAGDTVIFLNNIDLIKEAFSKDVFSGRPRDFFSREVLKSKGKYTNQ